MTLRTRLVALVAVSTLVTAAVVGLAAGLIVNRTLQDQVDQALTARVEGLLGRPLIVANVGTIARLTPAVVRRELRTSAAAEDFTSEEGPRILLDFIIDGVHLPDQGVTQIVNVDFAEADQMPYLQPTYQTVSTAKGPIRVATARLGEVQYVRAMRPLTDVRQLASSIGFTLAAWGVAIATVAAVVTALVVGRSLTPLRRLATAARRVAQTQDLRDTGLRDTAAARDDEIGELATSMAQMSDALALSREQQRQLVDDVAHEMRTPLTSIRANVDLLARSASKGRLSDEMVAGALADVASEVAEINELIGEVSVLAAPDEFAPEPESEVDVVALARGVVERAERRSGRAIGLRMEIEGASLNLLCAPRALERAISNIVGNAIKFASSGPIEVVISPNGIFVEDAGEGIAQADRPRVATRFWRSPKARALPGSGLGLSIASKVASDLGGELAVDVSKFGGARVGVVWSISRLINS